MYFFDISSTFSYLVKNIISRKKRISRLKEMHSLCYTVTCSEAVINKIHFFVGFQGLIFETEVEPEEKLFQGGLERFWKQVS